MAESKKSTRGSNYVKNYGRAKPALQGVLEWCNEYGKVDSWMGGALGSFFSDQAGVDRKLKFWHVHHKQFPHYNERMFQETKEFLEYYRNAPVGECHYRGLEEPSGGADPYFKKDPLTADKMVIPFRIIHTRELKPEECAEAALAFIDHDDFLGEKFNWQGGDVNASPLDGWDGDLLGVFTNSPDQTMENIRQKWFIPTNRVGSYFDPAKDGMITVVSESVVRTINWYLKKTDSHREFNVHRIEEIKEQFRAPGWQIKPSLKSYRLEWPTIRNLEEAAEITDNTLTGCIENLVQKHLGNEVANHINAEIRKEEVKLGAFGRSGDPADADTYDMEDVWEFWETKFENYRHAVAPLGNNVPKKLGEQTSEQLLSIANQRLAEAAGYNQELTNMMEKVVENVKSNAPDEEEKGGNTIAKGFNEDAAIIDVTRLYKETAEQTELFTRLGMVLAYPIPFTKAKPQVFTKVEGSYKQVGVAISASSDLTSYTFVGYEQEVEDEKQSYKSLAEIASKIVSGYDQYTSPNGTEITAEQIMWASDVAPVAHSEDIIQKGTKIVCPDPRTLPAKLLQRLNPQKKAK